MRAKLVVLGCLVPAALLAGSVSVDDVAKIVREDANVFTAEDLLDRLPESFRSNPIAMYKSESLQEASVEFPRMILFGAEDRYVSSDVKDRLFLAFNGSPKQKNFDTFEMIQFRAAAGSYEFAKVVFHPGQRPRFFSSPPECIRCHDSPGHPNWAPYADWPGAFPSSDGFSLTPAKEKEDYAKFLANQGKQGRYAKLGLRSAEDLTYGEHVAVKSLANLLQNQGEVFLAKQLEATRHFAQYRALLVGALKGCSGLQDFVPKDLLARFPRRLSDVVEETERQQAESYRVRSNNGSRDVNFSAGETYKVGNLRWVMERDGGSISPWFLSFDPQQWSVHRSRIHSVLERLSGSWPGDCRQLEEESLRSLQGAPFASGLKETTLVGDRNAVTPTLSDGDLGSAQAVLSGTCMRCHAYPKIAPVIAFDDATKLAPLLRARPALYADIVGRLNATDDRRMPPDRGLPKEAVTSIVRYLDELRGKSFSSLVSTVSDGVR